MQKNPCPKKKTCLSGPPVLATLAGLAREGRNAPPTNPQVIFENFITKKELARYFDISQSLINKLMAEDKSFPCIKIGRAVRFPLKAVCTWFENRGNKL